MRILSLWLTIVFWATSISPIFVAYHIVTSLGWDFTEDLFSPGLLAIMGIATAMTLTQILTAFLLRE